MCAFLFKTLANTTDPTTSCAVLRLAMALMSPFGPAFGLGLLVMGACSSATTNSDAAAPDQASDAIGNATDTTALPADAQNGDPALNCAVNYDEQVQRGLTRCSTTLYQGTGSCGRYLIVVERNNFDPGAECFYDTTTKTLVSYVYCSDAGSCQSSGAALDAPCGFINPVSGTVPLCVRDGGSIASDAQSD